MSRRNKLEKLDKRIDGALRALGDTRSFVPSHHHLLRKLYSTPGGLFIAWLTPGLPPPGPFG